MIAPFWTPPPLEPAPAVEALVREGAWVSYSVSGGKDSSAAIGATEKMLDNMDHPREKRILLHAGLGRVEWASTLPHIEALAKHFDLPLIVVKHKTHDMISRWERRGDLGRERWAKGETTNLIGPWSSASLRYCTSEMKIHVMSQYKKSLGGPVVTVMGIRRSESRGRSATKTESPDTGMKRFKREGDLSWNPIAHWSDEDVFAYHEQAGVPLHEAYGLGSTRLSCSMCVLANINDLTVASAQAQNENTYLHLVGMELRYGFSFQPSRWLADVRPEIISQTDRNRLPAIKAIARRRRELEANYPQAYKDRSHLNMTDDDWKSVREIRREIGETHMITGYLIDPRPV